jgi:hypothetical protein
VSVEEAIGFPRQQRITLTWDQFSGTMQIGTEAAKTITGKAS